MRQAFETQFYREAMEAYHGFTADKTLEEVKSHDGREHQKEDIRNLEQTQKADLRDEIFRKTLDEGPHLNRTARETLEETYAEIERKQIIEEEARKRTDNLKAQALKEYANAKRSENQDRKYYRIVAKSQGSIKEYNHEISALIHLQGAELHKNLQEQAREFSKTIREFQAGGKIEMGFEPIKEKGLEPEKGPFKGR